jgi:hypothetical protein
MKLPVRMCMSICGYVCIRVCVCVCVFIYGTIFPVRAKWSVPSGDTVTVHVSTALPRSINTFQTCQSRCLLTAITWVPKILTTFY